jgi:hypothetical protein
MYEKREDWLTREIQGVGPADRRLVGGTAPKVELPLLAAQAGSDPRPEETVPAPAGGRRAARRRHKRARR